MVKISMCSLQSKIPDLALPSQPALITSSKPGTGTGCLPGESTGASTSVPAKSTSKIYFLIQIIVLELKF